MVEPQSIYVLLFLSIASPRARQVIPLTPFLPLSIVRFSFLVCDDVIMWRIFLFMATKLLHVCTLIQVELNNNNNMSRGEETDHPDEKEGIKQEQEQEQE